jgi:hypothetical protein
VSEASADEPREISNEDMIVSISRGGGRATKCEDYGMRPRKIFFRVQKKADASKGHSTECYIMVIII